MKEGRGNAAWGSVSALTGWSSAGSRRGTARWFSPVGADPQRTTQTAGSSACRSGPGREEKKKRWEFRIKHPHPANNRQFTAFFSLLESSSAAGLLGIQQQNVAFLFHNSAGTVYCIKNWYVGKPYIHIHMMYKKKKVKVSKLSQECPFALAMDELFAILLYLINKKHHKSIL